MALSPPQFLAAKKWLFEQIDAKAPSPEIMEVFPDLSVDDAFRLQFALIDRRILQGETIIGMKAALTAKSMQEFFQVSEPSPGYLTSDLLATAGEMAIGQWVMTIVEPEIAFILCHKLEGPGVTTVDVLHATEGVMAAIEIGHLRYGMEKRSLQQFLAYNTLNGAIALGHRMVALRDLDLRMEGMVMEVDGQPVGSGTGVEAMGDPVAVVAWLANTMARFERCLEPGMVIITGSIIKGAIVQPGQHVRVEFTHLGAVEMEFKE